ncbi:MAG: thiamine diphosphokinase [Clostridia bacterium]|nr:thiamine diphosphokinase [Clostridia bacterium]
MSRCVILCAGPVTDATALAALLRPDDYFLAADGGWRLAGRLGVIPACLVADFDSMPPPDLPAGVEVVQLPVQKDVTDAAAAADVAYERGFRDFLLLGATGGRLDHQQGAFLLAATLARKGCSVALADERNEITFYTRSPGQLPPHPGCKVSLFAFGGPVTGLTVTGLAYELVDYTLSPYDALCVSNEFTDAPASVTFSDGLLMLFYSKD